MVAIWYSHNNLVSKKNQVDNAYGALDAMLKKRYDLLPNLINIVKTYVNYEKNILNNVSLLNEKRFAANMNKEELHNIDIRIASNMNNLLMQIQNYPLSKADNQFLRLQASWNEVEEQIGAARRAYNSAVTEYNNAFEGFPGNMFAKNMKFIRKNVLETEDTEKQNVNAVKVFTT
jgi:LemA protein